MVSPGHRVRLLLAEMQLDQNELGRKTGGHPPDHELHRERPPADLPRHGWQAGAPQRSYAGLLAPVLDVEEGRPDEAVPSGSFLLNDEQIKQAVRDGTLTITPFNLDLVQPASVDLTIGEVVMRAGASTRALSAGRSHELGPGELVNLRTRETLGLADDHAGRVGPMAAVSRFGIFMAHGLQVDPGYQGELEFCLFNASTRSYPLALCADYQPGNRAPCWRSFASESRGAA